MAEVDYQELQRRYGGRCVALRDGAIIASADSYDALSEQLDRVGAVWAELTIDYVEPATAIRVY